MNLKLIWMLWDLWSKCKKVRAGSMKTMGWKTITGAVLVGLGYAAKSLMSFEPALDQVGDAFIALGAVLGGVGIRAAIAKTGEKKS
jgi:hypothetical protein